MAAALADGRIRWDHARVIVEITNPRILATVIDHQELLVGLADRCRFEQWQAEVRALARLWDHDGGYDPNQDPDANRLRFATTLDGLVTLAGTLRGEDAQIVCQTIEARADDLHRQAVADHRTCPDLAVPDRATLRARALVELIRQALGVDLHSTRGPVVEATMVIGAGDPLDGASDPDGVPLDDGTVRVLGCDARWRALVEDHHGVPLHLSRTQRWASATQRVAARRRDGGCTFPGCGAPLRWCDLHHGTHWEHGGTTDLDNLAHLCRYHHSVIHRTGWTMHLDHDGWAIFHSPTTVFSGQRHGRTKPDAPPGRASPQQPPHAA